MASCMIHLYTGWRYAQKHASFLEEPAFYLGCVAPDCVNLDGFADKATRWHAHLRAADLDQWEENVSAFYHSAQGTVDLPLLAGYAVHILTDILWDRHFHQEIWFQAANLGPNGSGGYDPGWTECFRFDRALMQSSWWHEAVCPLLALARPKAINGLPASLLERYRQYVLWEYESSLPLEKPRIIILEQIEKLGEYLLSSGQKNLS
ncbi:MAG: zinc dependent phospholipase C family protein [Oscillospiraceae bacterium]|nr:zinc dependent phospholipase C family protein [Oscillospiraceae bacterium]